MNPLYRPWLSSDEFSQPSHRFPVTSRHSCAVPHATIICTSKMQCFICVTYMLILSSANPTKIREIATTHEKRSLFRDVIESLRIRSHISEDINPNNENKLSHYDRYDYDDKPFQLPSDSDFIPRRNDRIEMPSLKYRFPKNMLLNSDDENTEKDSTLHEFLETNSGQTTQNSKKVKVTQRPNTNKVKLPSKMKQTEKENKITEFYPDVNFPVSTILNGQSQIGNRESQTVFKPTVIVNIRGSVNHKDSDIRLEARDESNSSVPWQNIFNIHQEVKISKELDKRKKPVTQEIKTISPKDTLKVAKEIFICETATSKSDKEDRQFDNAFQILFSV